MREDWEERRSSGCRFGREGEERREKREENNSKGWMEGQGLEQWGVENEDEVGWLLKKVGE